jgi:hypothetical protein
MASGEGRAMQLDGVLETTSLAVAAPLLSPHIVHGTTKG